MGPDHAEQPARLRAVDDAVADAGLVAGLQSIVVTSEIDFDALRAVHDSAYVDAIAAAAPAADAPPEHLVRLDPDTAMNAGSLRAVRLASAAAVQAVDMVCTGQVQNAFCNVRPPGHHAETDRAMGFCLFNGITVAAAHARKAHGLERIAIIDFDVHYGNGTADIVGDDPNTLVLHSYGYPLYPDQNPPSSANQIRVPLPNGSDGAYARQAITAAWLPALQRFQPELVLISAGFDAHRDDPLAQLNWQDDDYRWVTRLICEHTQRSAQGRVVSVLEGGYALPALGRCAAIHIAELMTASA